MMISYFGPNHNLHKLFRMNVIGPGKCASKRLHLGKELNFLYESDCNLIAPYIWEEAI